MVPTGISTAILSLHRLIAPEALRAAYCCGGPKSLSEGQKEALKSLVKQDWATRRMTVMDMKGLALSKCTIQKGLQEKGLRSYREQWKFILDEENRGCRLRWRIGDILALQMKCQLRLVGLMGYGEKRVMFLDMGDACVDTRNRGIEGRVNKRD